MVKTLILLICVRKMPLKRGGGLRLLKFFVAWPESAFLLLSDVNSNISEMNSSLPHSATSTSGSSYIINSTVNVSCKLPNIQRGKLSPSAVPKTSMQIPNNASSNHHQQIATQWEKNQATHFRSPAKHHRERSAASVGQ